LKIDQVQIVINSCVNKRDKFIIALLWETGMRISELLSLWIEDFDVGEKTIEIKDRGELENLAEIKTKCSPRVLDVSSNLMNAYMDYICKFHDNSVDSNFVFIKIDGVNQGKPLEYTNIVSLFNRLKKKTQIYNLHPHIFRHTHLSLLRSSGWEIEMVQKRAGHKNYQSTLIYTHIDNEELHNSWKKIEGKIKDAYHI
jgi:integrase/recombinase XerD